MDSKTIFDRTCFKVSDGVSVEKFSKSFLARSVANSSEILFQLQFEILFCFSNFNRILSKCLRWKLTAEMILFHAVIFQTSVKLFLLLCILQLVHGTIGTNLNQFYNALAILKIGHDFSYCSCTEYWWWSIFFFL